MISVRAFLILSVFAAGLHACKPAKEKVDLIISHAKVYTADSSQSEAEAFAVKDGRFVAVGSTQDILSKYEADEELNAEGRPVYPGFMDAHCHFYSYGRLQFQADLSGTKSFQEVIDKLLAHVKQYPAENWIMGRGWDQNDWEVKDFPTKNVLDSLFPTTPVYLSRIDGHAALVNEAALEKAHITADTKIAGGALLKDKKGRLSGILLDNAADSVRNMIPAPDKDQMTRALLKAQEDAFAFGLTTIDDAGLDKNVIDLMDQLQKEGKLKMRIYAMLNPTAENKDHYYKSGPYKTDRLDVRSFKLYADGALGSRGAALLKPYSDKPNEQGFLLSPPEELARQAKDIYGHGFQVNTHCIGDSANRLMLDIYGSLLKGKNDKRWRIEHAQIVDAADMDKFGTYSIIPSVQPTHATSDMYWAEERLGKDRMAGAYAYRKLLQQNGLVALGSDYPVESVNPLLGFYAATARKDVKGYPEGGFQMQDALSRAEALYGMTLWAAYANFEEKEKGSITAGKLADFVILDRDVMKVPLAEIPQARVWQTWLGGEKVYASK